MNHNIWFDLLLFDPRISIILSPIVSSVFWVIIVCEKSRF